MGTRTRPTVGNFALTTLLVVVTLAQTQVGAATGDDITAPGGLPNSTDALTTPARTQSKKTTLQSVPDTNNLLLDTGQSIISVPRFDEAAISIDGDVNEPIWASVPAYENMLVMDPDSLAEPAHRTYTRFLFTQKGLYVSAVMEQPEGSMVERLSARDEFINRDSFGITLDTSGQGLYGYWFVVNLGGSLMDGRVAPERNFTSQWDGPWRGASSKTPDGWSTEMFLPWSMMSMPAAADNRIMRFWVNRKVAYRDERYGWPALPFASAQFMSVLQPMSVPGIEPGQQWAAFPFLSSTYDNIERDNKMQAGLDVFWRPTSNLQITTTINPDFGAVESDDVVVNLSAFEVFFPEKRLFFLEGTEVFVTSPRSNPRSGGGPGGSGARRSSPTFTIEPTTLLNTRRIGGAARHLDIPDDITVEGVERSKPTSLIGAAKAVGQVGGLRYGVLGAFEEDARLAGADDLTGLEVQLEADARNFGVARILYEQSGNGRRAIGYMGTIVDQPGTDAVVHGVDTHFLSSNGKWLWDAQMIASDADDQKGYGFFSDISYTPRTGIQHRLGIDAFDDKLDVSDLGYIRRNDVFGLRYQFTSSTSRGLPQWLRNRRWGGGVGAQANSEERITRNVAYLFGNFLFNNRSELRAELDWFGPRWDDRNSRGNGSFKLDDRFFGYLSFGTNSALPFSTAVQLGFEQEELGGLSFFADFGLTYKPVPKLSFNFDVRVKKRDDWLVYQEDRNFTTFNGYDVQPRIALDYFLTARQQLRFTLQWAGIKADEQEFYQVPLGDGRLMPRQGGNETEDFTLSLLTAQLRYRWEIGPLSDLFVVYTRGSNLENQIDDSFANLFIDAAKEPIIDVLVVKLRYRFGS